MVTFKYLRTHSAYLGSCFINQSRSGRRRKWISLEPREFAFSIDHDDAFFRVYNLPAHPPTRLKLYYYYHNICTDERKIPTRRISPVQLTVYANAINNNHTSVVSLHSVYEILCSVQARPVQSHLPSSTYYNDSNPSHLSDNNNRCCRPVLASGL